MNGTSNACMPTRTALSSVEISPVDSAINFVANQQSTTHDLISLLDSKLGKVLTPPAPPEKGLEDAMPGSATELLEHLSARGETAVAINRRLQQLIDRIVL